MKINIFKIKDFEMKQNINLKGIKLVCLMPSYNKAKTISKAIQSVLMQKADFKFKLIIIDDCSSDESYAKAQELAKTNADKIILLKNQSNLGQLHSMNGVYPLLQGVEYFCVLDPDDWYIYDKKFADAVAFLDSHKNYTSYLTNCIINNNGDENLWYGGEKQILDFDWNDYLNGNAIIAHTSAGIYRNVYFYEKMHQKFLEFTQKDYGGSFSADGFRGPWHLNAGKAHFVNNTESVYNYNYEGEWSSMSEYEQKLHFARLHYAFSEFFSKDREHFLQIAKRVFDETLCDLRAADEEYILKNKALILSCFEEIDLNPHLKTIKEEKNLQDYKVRILGLPCLKITQTQQSSKVKLFGKIELLKIAKI